MLNFRGARLQNALVATAPAMMPRPAFPASMCCARQSNVWLTADGHSGCASTRTSYCDVCVPKPGLFRGPAGSLQRVVPSTGQSRSPALSTEHHVFLCECGRSLRVRTPRPVYWQPFLAACLVLHVRESVSQAFESSRNEDEAQPMPILRMLWALWRLSASRCRQKYLHSGSMLKSNCSECQQYLSEVRTLVDLPSDQC